MLILTDRLSGPSFRYLHHLLEAKIPCSQVFRIQARPKPLCAFRPAIKTEDPGSSQMVSVSNYNGQDTYLINGLIGFLIVLGFLIITRNYIIISGRIKKLASDYRWLIARALVWLDDFNFVDLFKT